MKGGTHMNKHYTLAEYQEALQGAGPKLKELILERAAHEDWLDLMELRELAKLAYPDDAP